MTVLNVRHTTIYRYSRPVMLGDHRLMLRPRDSHDLRLIKTNLTFSPPASVRWMHDVFGNSVAIASFSQPAAELRIESDLMLETYAAERPPFQITPDASRYPFVYSADDRIDLGRMLERQYPDPNDRLGAWARGFVRSNPTDTSALLADLNSGVKAQIFYQSRETEGTQTPVETLIRGWGSCRDLAVLVHRSRPQPRLRRTHRDRAISIALPPIPVRRPPSAPARRTPGPTSMCPARAGSPTIPPTAPSAARI